MEWRARFEAEIEKAEQARARSNEGKARVCARRAAGIAAEEFLARRGARTQKGSAMAALEQLMIDSTLPADLTPLLAHLVQQVDGQFKLPAGVDLLADARRLRELLLRE